MISELPKHHRNNKRLHTTLYFLCQAHISVHHKEIPECCLNSPSWSKGSVDVKMYPFHPVGIRSYLQVM